MNLPPPAPCGCPWSDMAMIQHYDTCSISQAFQLARARELLARALEDGFGWTKVGQTPAGAALEADVRAFLAEWDLVQPHHIAAAATGTMSNLTVRIPEIDLDALGVKRHPLGKP